MLESRFSKQVEIREKLIEEIEADLIGPRFGETKEDRAYEILPKNRRPENEYYAGVLYPGNWEVEPEEITKDMGDDDDDNALFSGVAAATQMSNQSRPTMATRTVGGHVALGGGTRGVPRGNKPAPMKLGAKKLNAKDIDLESMLN